MKERDRVELQSKLLLCAGAVPACEKISSWVVEAMRPGRGRQRTDVTLFGVCEEHRENVPELLGLMGYSEAAMVEWEGLGELLSGLERAGLLG